MLILKRLTAFLFIILFSAQRNAQFLQASKEEIMEAVWVAAEMRAGAAYAHSALAMDEILAAEKNITP